MTSYLDESSIVHQTTCPSIAEQNGVVERKNRTLLKIVCVIMFTMHVPKTFWSDVQTATYLMNRLPTQVLSYHTPLEVLSHSSSLFPLPPKTFDCICFVNIPKFDCTKLDPKALKCVFLGYAAN